MIQIAMISVRKIAIIHIIASQPMDGPRHLNQHDETEPRHQSEHDEDRHSCKAWTYNAAFSIPKYNKKTS